MSQIQANNRYKTSLCKHYDQGSGNQSGQYCPLGSRCHFAHGKVDVRNMQEPLPPQAQVLPVDPMTALLQQSTVGLNYKTILCKNFSTMGVCKYGSSCHFAHGEEDIKKPEQTAAIFQAQSQAIMMQQMNQKILMYQLQYILYQIQQNMQDNHYVMQKVKIAAELWTANNIQAAAQMITVLLINQEIVSRDDASENEKIFYKKVTDTAKNLAENYIKQLNQQGYGITAQP